MNWYTDYAARASLLRLVVAEGGYKSAFLSLGPTEFWKKIEYDVKHKLELLPPSDIKRTIYGGPTVLGWIKSREKELEAEPVTSMGRNRTHYQELIDSLIALEADRQRLLKENRESDTAKAAMEAERERVIKKSMGEMEDSSATDSAEVLLTNRSSTRSIKGARLVQGRLDTEAHKTYDKLIAGSDALLLQNAKQHEQEMAATEKAFALT